MLKGRGKVFAPKKVVRKPQGSAPSSSRPSVERSSQTPAPQPSQESIPAIAEKVTVPESANGNAVPHVEPSRRQPSSQEVQGVGVTSVTQDGGGTGRPELKRKERENVIAPPPPKRVSTATENPNLPPPPIEPTIIHISSQENTPQPEPNPALAVASNSQPQSQPIPKPASQAAVAPKPPTARPKIIPPKVNKKAVDASISQPAAPVSPKLSRQGGPSRTVSQPPAPESVAPTAVPPQASVSVPTAPAATISTPRDPEQAPETVPEEPIQTIEEERPSPSPERSPEPPRHRYPSPQNIVRLADEGPAESSSMGRAGGGGIRTGTGDMLMGPGEVHQASEIVPVGALNPDGTSGALQVDEPASATEGAAEKGKKPKRKYTKRKKVQPPGDGEDARTTLGMSLNKPRRVASAKRKGKKKKDGTRGRKERAETPEGASDEEIDQSTLTMTDLCRDLRIGKKFSRHKEIKDRVTANKRANLKKKMIMNNPEIDGLVGDGPLTVAEETAASGSGDPAADPEPEREPTPEVAGVSGEGPQIRLVDGQLVVDESSLQIDRHARARATAGDMEEVIEDDFTRIITSGTYMKREKSMLWDHAATIRFYEGLAQFGTDFEMIAKLFPHRNRRQIKLKFNKEERAHPERVTKAMVGPKKKGINLENFERLADFKLEDVATIEAEYEKYENQMLAKEKEEMDAAAEITRQKKAAIQGTASAAARKILATVDSDDEEPSRADSAKENGKGRRRGAAKKKNKHSHYAGGEKVTVLETLNY